MMNAGELVPNAYLMREKRVDENSAKAVQTSSGFPFVSVKSLHCSRNGWVKMICFLSCTD